MRAASGASDWENVAHRGIEALIEHPREPFAFAGIFQVRCERVDVRGQSTLAPQVVERVLVRAEYERRREAEEHRHRREESLRCRRIDIGLDALVGDEVWVLPDRLPILAPEAVERPARQRLAR